MIENFEKLQHYLKGRDKSLYAWPHAKYIDERRSGNTTRIAEKAIELLLEGKFVFCEDHYEDGASENANRYLVEMIVKKLKEEHKIDKYSITWVGVVPIMKLK